MDYKILLKKYMATVVNFDIDHIPNKSAEFDEWDRSQGLPKHMNPFQLTDEEIDELQRIRREIEKEEDT